MGIRNSSAVRREKRDGKSRLIIDFRYLDKAGREHRYRRDASVQNASAARLEAERLQSLAQEHGTPEPEIVKRAPAVRLGDFFDSTFSSLYLPRYRPTTRTRYEALMRQGLRDHFGATAIEEITTKDIRAYAVKVEQRGVQLKGPLLFLRTLLRSAVDAGVIDTMPEFPRVRSSRKLPDAPTEDEVSAMLRLSSGWLRPAIALATYAGLRMGEVRALEVGDVDLKAGTLLIRRALSEEEVTTPKSGNDRAIPIAPELAAVLTEAIRGKLPRARIVVTNRGTSPKRTHVLSALKSLQKREGLRSRSFHSLRHFFCSTLLRRGANVEVVRVLAGHSNLAVTMRYVHAVADDLRSAIANAFVSGGLFTASGGVGQRVGNAAPG